MSRSSSGSRLLIALLLVAVVALSVALYWVTRATEPTALPAQAQGTDPASISGQVANRRGGVGGFGPVAGHNRPTLPPARRQNELGQPLNADGRPIGPAANLGRPEVKRIAPGQFPLIPPRIQDEAEQVAFKRWWKDEFTRRVEIYQRLEPRQQGYPSSDEIAAMIDEMYDAGLPRGERESVDDVLARRQHWRARLREFTDGFGAPPYTIITRAGDPQYGETPPSPINAPPAEPVAEPEPAPPADKTPSGRSADEPGGTAPISERADGTPSQRDE